MWGYCTSFTAYGHMCFPVDVVMSDSVISWRLILHVLSCLSSFSFLYFLANSSIIYLLLYLSGEGIHSFCMWILLLHSISVWRIDVSHVDYSHFPLCSPLIGCSTDIDIPDSNWEYSWDCIARSPPLSPFLMLPRRSCICFYF